MRGSPFLFFWMIALAAPATANPLLAPTVQYVADVEITRDSDHSYQVPARYVYAGRRMRVEFVGIVKLIDLDLQQSLPMIPRVRTYWSPETFPRSAKDGRRWVGVEAATAESVGTEMILGRQVTKYQVRGSIFEMRTPFEGYVWTTPENIVLQVDGVSRAEGVDTPIKVTPVQLVIGPVDASLLTVPNTYAKADPVLKVGAATIETVHAFESDRCRTRLGTAAQIYYKQSIVDVVLVVSNRIPDR